MKAILLVVPFFSGCALPSDETGDSADTGPMETGSGESGTDTATSGYGQAVPFRQLEGEDAWLVSDNVDCDTIFATWLRDEAEVITWEEEVVPAVSFPPGSLDSMDWSAEDLIVAYIDCPGEGYAIDLQGVWDDGGRVTVAGTIVVPPFIYDIPSRTFVGAAVPACDACAVTHVETTIGPAP